MRHIKQKSLVAGILLLLAWSILICIGIASMRKGASYTLASRSVLEAVFIAPTATVTASSSPSNGGGLDPAIIAAIIGLGGVVVGAVIAGAFTISSVKRTARAQDKQLRVQHQQAQEIARLQQELQEQAQAKERERQRKEMSESTALAAMQSATTQAERVQAYRAAVHADPRIARLQILDMERPLEVTSIYVRVRLHQETRLPYNREEALQQLDAKEDPTAFLKAHQLRLEQRVGSSLDPDDAVRKYKRCVVVGDPGAGKTTLLKYLALKSIENLLPGLPDIPVHI